MDPVKPGIGWKPRLRNFFNTVSNALFKHRDVRVFDAPETIPFEPLRSAAPKVPVKHRHIASSQTKDKKLEIQRRTLKSLHQGQLNLLIGDISKLNQILGQPVDAITCAIPRTAQQQSPLFSKLASLDSALNRRRTKSLMTKLPPGRSIILETGKLTPTGYKKVILSQLPGKTGAGFRRQMLSAYLSALRKASQKNSQSIALPLLTSGYGLSPKASAEIAKTAVQHWLRRHRPPTPAPCIYLVFPNTHEGRNQYLHQVRAFAGSRQSGAGVKSYSSNRNKPAQG